MHSDQELDPDKLTKINGDLLIKSRNEMNFDGNSKALPHVKI
jgi:hypothetical protein